SRSPAAGYRQPRSPTTSRPAPSRPPTRRALPPGRPAGGSAGPAPAPRSAATSAGATPDATSPVRRRRARAGRPTRPVASCPSSPSQHRTVSASPPARASDHGGGGGGAQGARGVRDSGAADALSGLGGPGDGAALTPAPGRDQAQHDDTRQGDGHQARRDRDGARGRGKLAEYRYRPGVGSPAGGQAVAGLELLGGGQRLRAEYPVVINARVRRVGIEQLLQRGDARAFLRVGDDGRAGREADVVAVANRRLISVVSAENCEQRHEKD